MQAFYQSIRQFLWDDVRLLLVLIAIGAGVGNYYQHMIEGVCISLLVFIIWYGRALYKLIQWVQFHSDEHPPDVRGLLGDLSQRVYKNYKNETKLRKELLSNVHRVQSSISSLENAIVLMDKYGNIEWWNPAADFLLGLRKGDKGNNIQNLIREPSFIDFYNQESHEDDLKVASWLEAEKHLKISLTAFGSTNKLMIVADVTRLHALEQVRKDFIANVSHELKTPLTVFSGYLETFVAQDNLSPAWQRGCRQMQQQAHRMNNIVNDLLILSRLENNHNNTKKHSMVDVPEIMTQLFDQAQALNEKYGHALDINIDSQAHVYANKKELVSAFGNLLFNAMKYTPNGGEISMAWLEDDTTITFSVTDNGIGIAPEHISRLTERFYRVDAGRSRDSGGTGLGLAIVKHIVQHHDAQLTIQSELEIGSTFNIVFSK